MIRIIYDNYVLCHKGYEPGKTIRGGIIGSNQRLLRPWSRLQHCPVWKTGKETAPAGAKSGAVHSDAWDQVCKSSLGRTQEIRLWLKLGELVDISSCADHETMSKMSCYDELCLSRVSSHASYCPVSSWQYSYFYVCSQLCQIKGW